MPRPRARCLLRRDELVETTFTLDSRRAPMPTFNSLIDRADADVLIPQESATEIIAALPAESAAMRLFRRTSMGTKITRQPVLSTLGTAYWVNGDTGLKQTTELAWEGVDLV